MLANEASEPLAQSTGLVRNPVQLTWHRSRLQLIQGIRWNELGLSQPVQKAITIIQPVDRRIGWCRDRIQEIEAERVGNKNCRQSMVHNWTPEVPNRITCQITVDKLWIALT